MKNDEKRLRELFGDMLDSHLPAVTPATNITEIKYDDDFDIVKLMDSARDPNTGLLRDLKIDDRDLATASSFYDYAFNIIGNDAHPPWIMQGWIGLMLFGEVCPVCSDKRWLSLEWVVENVDKRMPFKDIKSGLKILKHGKCPKCKRDKWDLIKNHGLNNYTELLNVLGQRSGKSSSAALYSSYHLHRFLKFPRLADHTTSMQRSTELTGTFVSLTFNKAVGLLWTPFKNIVKDARWFKEYHDLLADTGARYGVELFHFKELFLSYQHKSLRMYPTGPNPNTLRGDTRFLAAIDELGLFPLPKGTDEEDENSARANADEAHKSLTNSLVTVQTAQLEMLEHGLNCPPALMIGVSSPISMRDKVMRRLQDARSPSGRKFILGVNLPTWKVNPTIHRNSPIIEMAYASNAEKAERDFGANPPRISQSFIKSSQVANALFNGKQSHSFKYHYDLPGCIYGKVTRQFNTKWPSVLCLDAGHVNNSFSLIGAHFDFDKQKTVVSTVIEVMVHDNRKADFNAIYLNLILQIAKDINAVVILADQWQSLDILSRAQADLGIIGAGNKKPRCVAKQHSPKRKDFDSLVAMLENNSIEFPFLSPEDYHDVVNTYIEYKTLVHSPVKHLFLQMLTIKDEGEGKCPGKGEGFTDDLFRALVLAVNIHNPKIMQRLAEARNWPSLNGIDGRAKMPTPVYISRGAF